MPKKEKNGTKKLYKLKRITSIVLCMLFLSALFCGFNVLAETPSADSGVTSEITTATPTGDPDYLYDFTPPPYENSDNPMESISPDATAVPGMSEATIDIVKLEKIERKREFRWSDLIKYIAYGFFGLAGAAIIYGLFSMFVLIIFKKDITLSGIKQRKKKNQKKEKSRKNKK